MESNIILTVGDMDVPCILREPDLGTPNRAVLGIHGLGGSMRDALQDSVAEELELFGYVVLRFDLPAHGDNLEDVLTLEGCVETLRTAARFLRERYPALEELCIFAVDFGAYVALTALQSLLELPVQVRLVIQTPSLRMDQTMLKLAKVSQVTLEAMDWAVVEAERPIGITYEFYEELRDNTVLTTYPIPFLILHGEQDQVTPLSDVQQLHSLNERSKVVLVPGAGHGFREPGAVDMVLDLVRDWFDFEQVLLTDAY